MYTCMPASPQSVSRRSILLIVHLYVLLVIDMVDTMPPFPVFTTVRLLNKTQRRFIGVQITYEDQNKAAVRYIDEPLLDLYFV